MSPRQVQVALLATNPNPNQESGTRLILTLKEEADKYTEDFTLRDMLKR